MRLLLKSLALALLAGGIALADPVTPVDPPSLSGDVGAGKLPPAALRLPADPLVGGFDTLGRAIGKSGGTLRILLPKDKDIRLLNVWGYARLVAYDENFDIKPDILESLDVKDGRIFTMHLRKGHKWSDGAPFTAEDFRYFWEDIANNKDLTPAGVPEELLVDGAPPTVTIVDETTVRYEWAKPNPRFLPLLAGAREPYIYRPAHYLKQFHQKYGDEGKILDLVSAEHLGGWARLHNKRDSMYNNDNPDIPTLEPFVIQPGAGPTFHFKRNPYFHRVDANGMQLPYIDAIDATVVEGSLIAAKTAAGDSDLQARGLAFADATALKASADSGHYRLLLWPVTNGSEVVLYPNLTVTDPGWRALVRDKRFRQALSAAINRDDINQTLFYGLATPGNNTALKESPLYEAGRVSHEASFDLAKANGLLDQIGLTQRDGRGIRLMPDGRPLDIVVETSDAAPEAGDVLQLIAATWRQAGIGMVVRPFERTVMRKNAYSGEAVMTVWTGLDNGVPRAWTDPAELAPVKQESLQWPRWGQYITTKGASGEPCDMPEAQHLLDLYQQWNATFDNDARTRIWTEMLNIMADEQFTIGTVSDVMQPVVVNNALRNVPEQGFFGWDPGAQFGIYRFDAFWLDR